MDTNLKELQKKLYTPLPDEAITKHPTKTYLSSIKAIYVTDRLNDVFGVGKWTQKVNTESVDTSSGMVVVKVTFEVPSLGIYYESFGGNDNGGSNNKNFDLGDAYKGATTDALTKIGSYLGIANDVFKGKHDSKPTKTENKRKIETWLTEDQFNTAMKSDKKGITATISTFTSGNKGMKKDYLTKLSEQLKKLS